VPGNLGRNFTLVPDFKAGAFEVKPQSKRITVAKIQTIKGQVLDHTGSPAVGARVHLLARQRFRFEDGKLMRLAFLGDVTDKNGRFTFHPGMGRAKGLVVSTPTCHVWYVPITDETDQVAIRLPKPATLKLLYGIPGDDASARIQIQLKVESVPGWRQFVDGVERLVTVRADGRVVLGGMIPGVYRVWRWKNGVNCDRRELTLTAGKTATASFVRKTGHPVTGRITGMPPAGAPTVKILVQRKSGATVDALRCKPNARFTTARLSPGVYTIIAKAYAPVSRESESEHTGTGFARIPTPAFTGSATVTVVKDKPPAEVVIPMRKPKPRS
jgi:hypothetical protein